jgi:hypothetical protein
LSSGGDSSLLVLVELIGLELSIVFQSLNDGLLGPASELSQISQDSVLSVISQSNDFEGLWDNESLFVVVGERNAIEDLQSAQSSSSSWEFVGKHASDCSPEDTGWSSVVNMASSGICVSSFVEEFLPLEFVSEEGA